MGRGPLRSLGPRITRLGRRVLSGNGTRRGLPPSVAPHRATRPRVPSEAPPARSALSRHPPEERLRHLRRRVAFTHRESSSVRRGPFVRAMATSIGPRPAVACTRAPHSSRAEMDAGRECRDHARKRQRARCLSRRTSSRPRDRAAVRRTAPYSAATSKGPRRAGAVRHCPPSRARGRRPAASRDRQPPQPGPGSRKGRWSSPARWTLGVSWSRSLICSGGVIVSNGAVCSQGRAAGAASSLDSGAGATRLRIRSLSDASRLPRSVTSAPNRRTMSGAARR